MNYQSLISEEEIRYICSVIPMRDVVLYFQHHSKEFAKIRPGFRATAASIGKMDVVGLLFNNRDCEFIALFIEKHIEDWLSQIKEHLENCIKDGDSKELALLHTLPYCFFAGNVTLYFKLMKEDIQPEKVILLDAAIKNIKDNNDCIDAQRKEIKSKELELERLNTSFETSSTSLKNIKHKLSQVENEFRDLVLMSKENAMFRTAYIRSEHEVEQLHESIRQQTETIRSLTAELSKATNSKQLLEAQMLAELEKQQKAMARERILLAKPKCPIQMDEFIDYLGYNFESIGIPASEDYFPLLTKHLSRVLFRGIPIIINRYTGIPLLRCISNTLVERPDVATLIYRPDISIDEIDTFLMSAGRIGCLDNFIGNCNETELIHLFDRHRGQIVFLTYSYDRTLKYVSEEFLRYCQHLNLNSIVALTDNAELSEDPSYMDEIECPHQELAPDGRYSPMLREILRDFGYTNSLIEFTCASISNENDICSELAFNVLPYCRDVLQVAPFNTSERLVEYAGDNGRCAYKNLFRRWFA